MKAINLKCEHLKNPIGIDVRNPYLSWNLYGGKKQSAFCVKALCNGKEVWTTGKVLSSAMNVVCAYDANSRDRVEWTVQVWDENEAEGEVSDVAYFEYAFLSRNDLVAKWINPEIKKIKPKENQAASYLFREFDLTSIENARAYVSAHGVYALYINGQRVMENILTPGTSEYWYRLPYQTFDVEKYLKVGKNRIDVILGDGWYRGCNGNTGTRNVFGTDIAFLLQLEIDKKIVVITDESWQAAQDGPIYFNDIQLGERVDARKQPHYHAVKIEKYGFDNLLCVNTLPILEKESFAATLISTPDGAKVLDFGQNMSGYVEFKLNAKSGQRIRLTFGESLNKEGNFTDDNLQTIGRKYPLHQVVDYICKDGLNVYKPSLCIFGFQMVKVETDIQITGEEFTAHAVYSDMEQTATFECDNKLVNQFFVNTMWSQKSNFVDIPMDCPQRERSGWMGDAGVFVNAGLMLMDCYSVFARWLGECRVNQYKDGRVANMSPRRQPKPNMFDKMYDGSTAWGDASVIVPYTMYKLYGDKKILEDNYDMMRGWLGYCEKKARKTRLKNKFKKNPYKKYTIDTGMHWGEWLEAGISMQDSVKDIIFNGCPDVATAYFAYSSRMLSEIAEILGKLDDSKRYRELYENARKAYNYIEVKDGTIHSQRQCKYVRPLFMGLLDEKTKVNVAKDLNNLVANNNYMVNTGFLSTGSLCKVLADNGYTETAYKLLLQEGIPGWLYQVKQGATTVWESWEGNMGVTGVASLNHYSKGAVVAWFLQGICGINVCQQSITIKPQPNSLMKYAKAQFESPVGLIQSSWRYLDDCIEYNVTIPANTVAKFVFPDGTDKTLLVGENKFTSRL